MKRALGIAALLVAAGCGKGSGDSGSTAGGVRWGCQNRSGSCSCESNPTDPQFSDPSCTLPTVTCAFTSPAAAPGETDCTESSTIPASQCATVVSQIAGAEAVARCPPPSLTTATSSASGTATNGRTTAGTASATNGGSASGSASNGGTGTTTSRWTNGTAGPGGANGTGSTNASTGTGSTGASTNAGTTNASTGTSASTSTGGTGGSGGAGTTGSPVGLNSGYGQVSGSDAFTVAGAFSRTGTDRQSGQPTLSFMMFSAPMTCAMLSARIFPLYYGTLPDQRVVFTNDSTAAQVQYPDTSEVVFDPTDGGAPFYYDLNGTPAPYVPVALSAFPQVTPVVIATVTSTDGAPVGPGSYPLGSNSHDVFGRGTLDLGSGRLNLSALATSGNVDYASVGPDGLSGSFGSTLIEVDGGATVQLGGSVTAVSCAAF